MESEFEKLYGREPDRVNRFCCFSSSNKDFIKGRMYSESYIFEVSQVCDLGFRMSTDDLGIFIKGAKFIKPEAGCVNCDVCGQRG